jgi:hypothetical protein
VAAAIDRHQGAEAYDQVVVGYLLQIATELKTATGADAAALRSRSARLIGALKPDTLRRLVQMGGDAARRNAFVHDAAEGMAVDAVVDLVKAAADASGQTISHGLVRMLTKLSAHAEAGAATAKAAADTALREQVHSLLSEWELADPNPDDYRRMLEYLATSSVAGRAADAVADDMRRCGWCRCRSRSGRRTARGSRDQHVPEGGRRPAARGAARAGAAGRQRWPRARARRLTQPMAIGAIASAEPLDEASLDYLMPSLSIDGYWHAARRAGVIAEPRDAAQAARSAGDDAARRRAARGVAARGRPLVRPAQHAAAARPRRACSRRVPAGPAGPVTPTRGCEPKRSGCRCRCAASASSR